MEVFLQIASVLMAAAAAAPAIRAPFWWVRIFDFPRAQMLIAGAAVLALDLRFLDLSDPVSAVTAMAVGLGVTVELRRVLPYTPVHSVQLLKAEVPSRENQLTVLTCNVLQENRDARRLLSLIDRQNPDIVLLLEVDEEWMEALRELESDYAYRLNRPQDDTYGMALYSRLKLVDPEIRFLRREHVPSIRTTVKLPSGRTFRLYGLHPPPPVPEYAETTAQRDAELVLVGREAKDFAGPVVVVGDLNDVAWSHTTRLFQRVSGLLDPRIGRQTMSTFPVYAPLFRFPLDHVFVSNHFKLVDFKRLEDVGSDHFPVWAALQLEARAEAEQPQPEPEGDDLEEACEIVAEADAENAEGEDVGLVPAPEPARA